MTTIFFTLFIINGINLTIVNIAGYETFIRYRIKTLKDEKQAYILETKIYPVVFGIICVVPLLLSSSSELLQSFYNYSNLVMVNIISIFWVMYYKKAIATEQVCVYIKSLVLSKMKGYAWGILMLGTIISGVSWIFKIINELCQISTIGVTIMAFIISCIYNLYSAINFKVRDYLDEIWITFSTVKEKYNINSKNIREIVIENNACVINYLKLGDEHQSEIAFEEEEELRKIIPVLEKYNINYSLKSSDVK